MCGRPINTLFVPASDRPHGHHPASLLERLRQPEAPQAWEHFVKLYTPLLARWAQRLG